MIDAKDLRTIARARLKDAERLFRARRYDAGMYLCGYAVELALKARICKTLKWPGYPGTPPEFRGYQSFRTHDFKILLRLSGCEDMVRGTLEHEWETVNEWNPEVRYSKPGSATAANLARMLESTRKLLRLIC